MMDAVVDVAAQFGGRDAAQAVLPHFKALKEATKSLTIPGFLARNLTFILRVDGEVNSYGEPGPNNVDVGKNAEYISVDICLSVADRENLTSDPNANPIVCGIMGSVEILAETPSIRLSAQGTMALEAGLREFCAKYLDCI